MFSISKFVEIDAGHRVPYHESKCRNLHGHRYKVVARVTASEVVAAELGRSDSGMVVDFGVIKQALMHVVHDKFDHKLILWEKDSLLTRLSREGAGKDFERALAEESLLGGLVVVPCIPTAEELARYWGQLVAAELTRLATGLRIGALDVHETPTSVASWTPIL